VTSSPSQPSSPLFVGIDVAKDKLDLATSDGERVRTFANDPAAHRRIVDLLATQKPARVVIESTGGYEWPLIQALLEADLPVAHVNPTYVRHLAIGLKILAKTDPIDARVLVRYARLAEPVLLERCSKNQAELAALVTCRRQLGQTLTQQTNRRGMTRSTAAIKAIDQVIRTIERQVADLDAAIRKLIDSDDHFNDLDRLLRTVPGIGPVASATLVSQMPELGKTDRRQAPALLGVVPYNHDSGKLKGQRSIFGGRAQPRCVIYMATLAAIRCNPIIRDFARRLRAKGKKAKVVIVACMRKLITLVNAMIRDGLEWTQLNLVKNFAANH
jgi:transposase